MAQATALPRTQPHSGWLDALLSFFYPEFCQLCQSHRATPPEGYVCGECRGKIRRIEPPWCERCGLPCPGDFSAEFSCANCRDADPEFSYARSAIVARDTGLEVIHRYKYGRALWIEPVLASFLVERAAPELTNRGWHCLVPVPLHATRKRHREFNQAERLAAHLSRATGIPVNRHLLRRVRPTLTQTALTREERAENVRRAFEARQGARLAGERVVVIDDVFTTGATTGACAAVLKRLGAAEVCVWTVARGI